ncbi:Bicoid-interacting protein 3-domain-containing protein [Rhodotorula diobovata]|uniref:RNA methyltransferase n=1 Tax=Rhodotorula diobovata TaxID=5288 RepID=A0A5C5G6M5_9BASI|nr:Bicoid-interacting protein 3-domain-containing protein [Rhodotorula diobovata]
MADAPVDPPTNSALNKQNHREKWPYGNYRSYYSFRPGSTGAPSVATTATLDGRLALLDPALFRGKALLDIGTNSGKIALDALGLLGAARVVGVDIDPLLIDDCWQAAAARGAGKGDDRVDFVQGNVMLEGWFESFVEERRTKSSATEPATDALAAAPGQPPVEPTAREAAPAPADATRFDVVTLFSITKWLHLHHGDEGMLRLFRSLHDFLPAKGVVIVEPQEWDNYKRAVKRNKDLRETFKVIQLRPPFEQEMKDVGFKLEQRIEREEGGFSRPLLVWRKER